MLMQLDERTMVILLYNMICQQLLRLWDAPPLEATYRGRYEVNIDIVQYTVL